jgi:hypothetical protein
MLTVLSQYSSAQAIASTPLPQLSACLTKASEQRWREAEAEQLQHLAYHSAASSRAVVARSLVVRTLCLHLPDLRARLAELEAAIAQIVEQGEETRRLQERNPWQRSSECCHPRQVGDRTGTLSC